MAEYNQELTQQDFQKAVSGVCSTFGVQKLYPQQEKALSEFLNGSDVFVNLPTGYGKSLIYQMAPLVANELSKQHSRFPNESIVVIISPLVALMKDQLSFLKNPCRICSVRSSGKCPQGGRSRKVPTGIHIARIYVVCRSMETNAHFENLPKKSDWYSSG